MYVCESNGSERYVRQISLHDTFKCHTTAKRDEIENE